MERKRRSKKLVKFINVFAVILFLFGFISMMLCGFLQERGYGDYLWPAAGLILFFSSAIVSIVMIFIVYRDTILYEIDEKDEKYLAMDLRKLEGLNKENIREKLLKHRFKEKEGWYFRRKVFSLTKDFICYYVKVVDTLDLESTIDSEFDLYNEVEEKSRTTCLILLLCKDRIYEEDLKNIKEFSKNMIIWETVGDDKPNHNSILILVDNSTQEGYFLDMNSKMGISIYAHGSRLLKRVFSKN